MREHINDHQISNGYPQLVVVLKETSENCAKLFKTYDLYIAHLINHGIRLIISCFDLLFLVEYAILLPCEQTRIFQRHTLQR